MDLPAVVKFAKQHKLLAVIDGGHLGEVRKVPNTALGTHDNLSVHALQLYTFAAAAGPQHLEEFEARLVPGERLLWIFIAQRPRFQP